MLEDRTRMAKFVCQRDKIFESLMSSFDQNPHLTSSNNPHDLQSNPNFTNPPQNKINHLSLINITDGLLLKSRNRNQNNELQNYYLRVRELGQGSYGIVSSRIRNCYKNNQYLIITDSNNSSQHFNSDAFSCSVKQVPIPHLQI